ncbi:MAG: hypothetical protein NVSMB25_20330 [Thermoleophilaceae bacterium]
MQDEIEFMPLQHAHGLEEGGADLRRLHEVPVELAVEIGRTRMTIGQTLELRPGSVVSLNRLAGDPVDLLVNGKPIARGEVVVIDEEFGLRVTDVASSQYPFEDEVAIAEAIARAAEADLLARVEPTEAPNVPLAGASVEDIPLGMPGGNEVSA